MEEKKKSIRDAYHYYLKDPDHNGEQLISVLMNYKESWQGERKSHERQWRDNVAFYSGNHYVRDTGGSRSSVRSKLRENHTNNTIARMVSIFVQNLPIIRVFPASYSDIDVKNAENTETYGKYFWRTKKLEQKIIKFIKYTTIFSDSFIYPSWNPDLGDKIILNEDELDPSDTQNETPRTDFYHGDIQVDIDDPFRIFVRPGIDELDDMYDFIRAIPCNKNFLEHKYGEISAEPVTALNAYSGGTRIDSDLVMQNHYFHKPSSWFEEGLYVCWAGKKILRVRPANESERSLPLVHLAFDKPPMRFYGMSSIEQIMDLQEQLNRAASMIVEARNLVARPRVLASVEAAVPGQAITDRPGDILRFKLAGGPPKFEVPNFNFAEMQAHKADVRNAIQDVMGITSASRGVIPAATKTALALQLVLEQDRSQYLPFIKNFYQSISDMMLKVFQLAAENFDEDDPRVIKVEGLSGERTFHGGMVPSPLDIWMEDTNPIGWTAGARMESVLSLVDKKVVTDKNEVLEMLKMNNTDPAFQHLKIHKTAAQRENEDLKKGQLLDIGPEDDDTIHLDEHVKPMATYEFRSLPQAVQDAFKAHVEQHKQRLQGQGQAGQEEASEGLRQGTISPEQAAQNVQPPVQQENMQELLAQ